VALVEAGESRREVARLFDSCRPRRPSADGWWAAPVTSRRSLAPATATRRSSSMNNGCSIWLPLSPILHLTRSARGSHQPRNSTVGRTSVWRFYDRHRITFKKTLHAAEQDRPDVAAARAELKADNVFTGENGWFLLMRPSVTTKMVRHSGRCPRGERLVASVPHGHWKTLTFIAALRVDGLTAPYVIGWCDGWSHIHGLCRAGARANAGKR